MKSEASLGPDDARDAWVWVLKKNCSLSPRQLMWIFGTLAAVSVAVAVFWTAQGMWMVLPFAVVECGALGLAFFCYARHSTDGERVLLSGSGLEVERSVGQRVQTTRLSRFGLTVRLEEGSGLVMCRGGREELRVGRFVDAEGRLKYAYSLPRHFRGGLWRYVLFHLRPPKIKGPQARLFPREHGRRDCLDCGPVPHRDLYRHLRHTHRDGPERHHQRRHHHQGHRLSVEVGLRLSQGRGSGHRLLLHAHHAV
ncbi:MAG: DUF2244 domain-containing protein [Betaproteobacteria bacterium]|nr:DUF2244 domain-containing protein [Betaproteobacteria bacterium]